MPFTNEQRANSVLWYSQSLSATVTLRRFRAMYGQHVAQPSRKSIVTWHNKFKQCGSVNRRKREKVLSVRTPENTAQVIQAINNHQHTSLRRISNQTGMSLTSVWRTTKSEGFHPYKLQVVQELLLNDHAARVAFSQAQINLQINMPNLFDLIIFSDEAHFHLNGSVNRHNCRYWSDANPHWTIGRPLYSPRVTVWAAISRAGVIGPFFFNGNVNGTNYLNMLQNYLLPELQHYPHFEQLIFQQDGAPPYWTRAVREFLNITFPGRWIGRDSSFLHWPARSPDLTPMDFFLWGYVKSKVYTEPIENIPALQQRIITTFGELTNAIIDRAIASYERRLHRCLQINGRNVEIR